MTSFKRESVIFLTLFLLLSIVMHFHAWVDHPVEHFQSLSGSPLGAWHPLWIVTVVYTLLGIFRLIYRLLRRLFNKSVS